MVNIRNERTDKGINYSELEKTDTFLYSNYLYMKTSYGNAICLEDGDTVTFDDYEKVVPVDIEITIR